MPHHCSYVPETVQGTDSWSTEDAWLIQSQAAALTTRQSIRTEQHQWRWICNGPVSGFEKVVPFVGSVLGAL